MAESVRVQREVESRKNSMEKRKAQEKKRASAGDILESKSIYYRRSANQAQLACWGCSARFCLISLTLSMSSSACFFRLARSSADSTISALRR